MIKRIILAFHGSAVPSPSMQPSPKKHSKKEKLPLLSGDILI